MVVVDGSQRPPPPPNELFYYSAAHKVLICTACRYAVQPAAVARHLKEIHRIYRGARRPYTAYAAALELETPDKVPLPSLSGQFPVAHLPVEQGWRCTAPGCGYMCVSLKRIETHWPAAHGRKGDHARDWASCPLQTFFRGNMLRYFTRPPESESEDEPRSEPETEMDLEPDWSVDTAGDASSYHLASHHDLRQGHDQPETGKASYYIQWLQELYVLDSSDTLIIHHYFSSSYKNFVLATDASIPIWLKDVPRIATSNPFLMHGILACTALHMASLDPRTSAAYTMRACAHQATAIPLFRHAIENPTIHNADALVVFAYLLVVYAFATDVDNSNNRLLLVDDAAEPEPRLSGQRLVLPQWLYFIRAGCSMLCDVWDSVEAGPVRPLAYEWEMKLDVGDRKMPYLDHFLSIIPKDSSWSPEEVATYTSAATALAESLALLKDTEGKQEFTTWQVIGAWPARVDEGYMDLLAQRFPGALILLGYFCLILKRMDNLWYFKGRSAKLLRAVLEALDEKWHCFLGDTVSQVLGPEEAMSMSRPREIVTS